MALSRINCKGHIVLFNPLTLTKETMDKLPTEILQEIIGWALFTREELIANRLVCRRFCAVFTPHAFRTVRTNNFTRESFDRLCSIARTSHIAEFVVEYEYRLVEFLWLRKSRCSSSHGLLANLAFVSKSS